MSVGVHLYSSIVAVENDNILFFILPNFGIFSFLRECDTMANSIIYYSSKVPGGLGNWYPVIAESDKFVFPCSIHLRQQTDSRPHRPGQRDQTGDGNSVSPVSSFVLTSPKKGSLVLLIGQWLNLGDKGFSSVRRWGGGKCCCFAEPQK